jgi:hypothetical protein
MSRVAAEFACVSFHHDQRISKKIIKRTGSSFFGTQCLKFIIRMSYSDADPQICLLAKGVQFFLAMPDNFFQTALNVCSFLSGSCSPHIQSW